MCVCGWGGGGWGKETNLCVAILLSKKTHPVAQNSRSGDFSADNDRRTNRLRYPFAHAHAHGVILQ